MVGGIDLSIVIKFFFMNFCVIILYTHLLNLKPTRDAKNILWVYCLVSAVLMHYFQTFAYPLTLFVMVIGLIALSITVLQTPVNLSITTAVLSIGLGYAVYVPISLLLHSLSNEIVPVGAWNVLLPWLLALITGSIQILCLWLVLRNPRLRDGMPFLCQHGASDTGVFLSLSILLAATFLLRRESSDTVFLVLTFFIVLCGLILLFWWRNHLTKSYLEEIRRREMENMQLALEEKTARVQEVERQNEALSKIIHKDNKLIPAMELAVQECLHTSETDRLREKAEQLSAQLDRMTRERSGILQTYQAHNRSLPQTGVIAIDSLFAYMLEKATVQTIDFNLTLSGSIKYWVDTGIEQPDLTTLLGDLLDNALHATAQMPRRTVLLSIGVHDRAYYLDFYDSGTPFLPQTLCSLGLQSATTHPEDGGSGIGWMTAFELLEKYRASLLIEEFPEGELFTKRISFCFDGANLRRIQSARRNELAPIWTRNDIQLL